MNDAQTLISLLEKECRSLRRLIAGAIREEEFNVAAAHQRALNRTLARIHIIQGLEDRNFHRKEFLRGMISRWQDREYDLSWHEETRKELTDMEQLGPIRVPDSRILESQLSLVVSGALKGINVAINPTAGLVVMVRRQKTCIRMYLTHLRKLRNEHVIRDRQFRKLCAFGFEAVSEERLQMSFPHKADSVSRMMTILARMVFDLFYNDGARGQSYIEVVK